MGDDLETLKRWAGRMSQQLRGTGQADNAFRLDQIMQHLSVFEREVTRIHECKEDYDTLRDHVEKMADAADKAEAYIRNVREQLDNIGIELNFWIGEDDDPDRFEVGVDVLERLSRSYSAFRKDFPKPKGDGQ